MLQVLFTTTWGVRVDLFHSDVGRMWKSEEWSWLQCKKMCVYLSKGCPFHIFDCSYILVVRNHVIIILCVCVQWWISLWNHWQFLDFSTNKHSWTKLVVASCYPCLNSCWLRCTEQPDLCLSHIVDDWIPVTCDQSYWFMCPSSAATYCVTSVSIVQKKAPLTSR